MDLEVRSIFPCPFVGCSHEYSSASNLKQHLRKHDRSRGPYDCVICRCVFRKKSQLRQHVAATHKKHAERDGTTPEAVAAILACEPHICASCNRSFSSKSALDHHLRRHSQTPFVCSIGDCTSSFSFYTEYKKHLRTVHRLQHECGVCGKKFRTSRGLASHSRLHQADSPSLASSSPVVSGFRKPKSRKSRLFSCELCSDRVFSSRKALRRHVRSVHYRLSRFHCSYCETEFSEKSSLRRHLITLHSHDDNSAPDPTVLQAALDQCTSDSREFAKTGQKRKRDGSDIGLPPAKRRKRTRTISPAIAALVGADDVLE